MSINRQKLLLVSDGKKAHYWQKGIKAFATGIGVFDDVRLGFYFQPFSRWVLYSVVESHHVPPAGRFLKKLRKNYSAGHSERGRGLVKSCGFEQIFLTCRGVGELAKGVAFLGGIVVVTHEYPVPKYYK